MFIQYRLLNHFAVYFGSNLQTRPLSAAKLHLSQFLQARVHPDQFEPSFSAYQSYLYRTIEDNPEQLPQKIRLLDLATKIHSKYKFPSKKLTKLHNRLTDQCLEIATKEGISQVVKVLMMLQRFNKGRAHALFKHWRENILTGIRTFSPAQTITLLGLLREIKAKDPLIRQTAIEGLYSQINFLNPHELQSLLSILADSKKYINREFVQKVGQRLLTLYKCNNIRDQQTIKLLTSLSQIQKNLQTRAVYVQVLDELYELAFPNLFSIAVELPDHLLGRLVSSLRRSKHFDQTFLDTICRIGLTRSIRELGDVGEAKGVHISLKTVLNIFHTIAVFNYHQEEFKQYIIKVLSIVTLKQLTLQPTSFSRLLWSLCVLFERHQVASLYPLISQYISKAQSKSAAEATTIYYCYLYLRTVCPQLSQFREHIHSLVSTHHLQTHSSNIQLEVFNTMISMGVPCLPQYNLNNLICDIMIPEWKSLRNVVVEVHGFRHFCRNVKRPTGSNILKEKIISAEMFHYYYISIDEWLVSEDKQQFIQDFLESIEKVEQKKQLEKARQPTTSPGYVKRRARSFRVTSERNLLLEEGQLMR